MAHTNGLNIHRANKMQFEEQNNSGCFWINVVFDDFKVCAFTGNGADELSYRKVEEACAAYLKSKGWKVEVPAVVEPEVAVAVEPETANV